MTLRWMLQNPFDDNWISILNLNFTRYWFRQWFSAVKQQAIIWAIVDSELCYHMGLLDFGELTTYE